MPDSDYFDFKVKQEAMPMFVQLTKITTVH